MQWKAILIFGTIISRCYVTSFLVSKPMYTFLFKTEIGVTTTSTYKTPKVSPPHSRPKQRAANLQNHRVHQYDTAWYRKPLEAWPLEAFRRHSSSPHPWKHSKWRGIQYRTRGSQLFSKAPQTPSRTKWCGIQKQARGWQLVPRPLEDFLKNNSSCSLKASFRDYCSSGAGCKYQEKQTPTHYLGYHLHLDYRKPRMASKRCNACVIAFLASWNWTDPLPDP